MLPASGLVVPEPFATTSTGRFGEAGRSWLGALPAQVAQLCEEWQVALEPESEVRYGTWGLALAVRGADGPAILKVAWPASDTGLSAAALTLWDGRGAVRLLRANAQRHALLLERLDASVTLKTLAVGQALNVAGGLLRRLALPAPEGFPTLSGVAEKLADTLPGRWERQGRPLPRPVVERAAALARDLAPSAERWIVNWDIHDDNVLRAEREAWLIIDPQVLSGDLEYGVAQWLWWRLEEIETGGGVGWALDQLIQAANLDPQRTCAWSYVRTVDYWLWGLHAGLTIDPPRCERVIQALGDG